MFRKILVPVDLSPQDAVAVRCARDLVGSGPGSITLLHVVETIRDVPFVELEDFYHALRQKAEEAINRSATQLASDQVEVLREIVFGRRGPEIIRYAEEHGCDLIVLGSSPIDPDLPGAGFGTVSQQVALFARCSVLLAR